MSDRTLKSQVVSGLWLAAKTLLAIVTFGALVVGLQVIRLPKGPPQDTLFGRHPFSPWAFVITATAILIVTMDRWVKILPGILGYGTLGGLIMLATGHYGKTQVPRSVAVFLTLFMIVTSALTLSFSRRDLSLIDRIALVAFLYCLALFLTTKGDILAMKLLGGGLSILIGAWIVDRIRRRDGHESSRHQMRGPTTYGASRR